MTVKVCARCKCAKAPAEFSKCRRNKDGLQSRCRQCQSRGWASPRVRNCVTCGVAFEAKHHLSTSCSDECRDERAREMGREARRRRVGSNPEKYREAGRKWRETNPDYFNEWARKNPERSREIKQRYAGANRERTRLRQRERYAEHRDEYIRRSAEWRQANLVACREIKRRYRASQFGVTVHQITAEQIVARMSMFGNKCWMCGGEFEHIDHVKPLSEGGAHTLSNMRPACQSCNSRKGSLWPLPDWVTEYQKGAS